MIVRIGIALLGVLVAGIGVGVTVGMHLGERKVDKQLEAMVISIQMGLKKKCPVCGQPIVKLEVPSRPPTS